VGRALRDDLAALAGAYPRVVVLIDTLEQASEETCAWLEQAGGQQRDARGFSLARKGPSPVASVCSLGYPSLRAQRSNLHLAA
jgi:hypothetical protein